MRRLTESSMLLDRHFEQVQDAYSLRCHPAGDGRCARYAAVYRKYHHHRDERNER
ncbi:MAG: hypothetical protein R3C26_26750 [Calditrichia bacterium]